MKTKKYTGCFVLFCVMSIGLLSMTACSVGTHDLPSLSDKKISRFGEYRGYSERKYNSYVRESKYVRVRDGTRLAVDIYHPAIDGKQAEGRFPVMMTATRYWRAHQQPGGSVTSGMFGMEDRESQRRFLLEHGYNIVIFDTRGTGASFGQASNIMSTKVNQASGLDTYDIIEWSAAQPWSNGNVGMVGVSAHGVTQMWAAEQSPPSLKAVFSGGIGFAVSEGGFTHKVTLAYLTAIERLNGRKEGEDANIDGALKELLATKRVAPVDGPRGQALRKAAIDDHQQGVGERQRILQSEEAFVASIPKYRHRMTEHDISALNKSDVAFYVGQGWYDYGPSTALLYLNNLTAPIKAAVGPWTHGPNEPNDPKSDSHNHFWKVEALRWHDYWLKGIENGIMQEPALHYAIIDKDNHRWSWESANRWPDQRIQRRDFYLDGKPALPSLSVSKPNNKQAINFTVDYSATTGQHDRNWDASGRGPQQYPELSELNKKGTVFTSDVLKKDVALAGSPVVSLQMTGSVPDAQIHVFLEKVLPNGESHYVTDGKILTSWRKLGTAPFDNFGRPWSDGSQAAIAVTPPLNTEQATITFYLMPDGHVI